MSSYSKSEQHNTNEKIKSRVLREEGKGQDHQQKEMAVALSSPVLSSKSELSLPARKPRKTCPTAASVLLLELKGYHSTLEFSLLCTYTNTSAQRPNAVCPLSLTALPVGKPKPGSCQFQLRLRPCSPIKEALVVKGRPLFPKQAGAGGGG